jgi:hypothetical protein
MPARVGGGLPASREAQTRLRDLDDERRPGRMRGGVVARRPAHDADIRLGLGAIVENDRALRLDEPAVAERPLQCLRGEQDRRPVRAALRLLDDQQPVEQLDRIVLVEKTVVDQALLLVASPPSQPRSLRLLHGSRSNRIGGPRDGQCTSWDTYAAK